MQMKVEEERRKYEEGKVYRPSGLLSLL